jgi:glycolate oxidase iron-sulfur subunit
MNSRNVCAACSTHTIDSVQHRIPIADLGPDGERMARAVSSCVHCGFCLAACPTYKVMGEEMDSPRGRIMLMKQQLEGELDIADVRPFIDRCLGCLGCETACPSGVVYRDLVVPFRARLETTGRAWHERRYRQLLLAILESPVRFRAAYGAGRLGRVMSRVLPQRLAAALALLPAEVPPSETLPARTAPMGVRRAKVALLAGCVQQVLRPSINAAAVRLLSANGVEVLVPPEQACCGALALHSGEESRATRLCAHNRRVFPRDVDAILTTAAGCGSAMKEQQYPAKVFDVLEFLDALGLQTPLALAQPALVAYHDACHLSHGQGIRAAPRHLLLQIANLTLAELNDGELCCGSAGLYNLEQPAAAAELGRRKAAAIKATGAHMVAAGNIGCITQMEAHVRVPVRHTVEVLDAARTKPL